MNVAVAVTPPRGKLILFWTSDNENGRSGCGLRLVCCCEQDTLSLLRFSSVSALPRGLFQSLPFTRR
jgi:hypothetical protein